MKTKIALLALSTFLLYCCQKKDWTDSNVNDSDSNSLQISNIEGKTLKKWRLLSRKSDSIINSAQLMIQQQSDIVESCPQDEREYMNSNILEAQRHLDHFKNKVKYIKAYASHIQEYDPALEHTLDSLEQDCIQEKSMLENALSRLR
ncbi:hypothetical protein OD917_05145 [Flavobacterium sp. SH_e]|uniref:hypothetical protein n=1 Tax=Flavobacterium TaxID=237 RepID=UPI0021E39B24|nr:hypothetical protein [Flavobacterium sp. SH_e]MCV2484296.1 hypothetical protein [Flavobacterium sp. SH_e]